MVQRCAGCCAYVSFKHEVRVRPPPGSLASARSLGWPCQDVLASSGFSDARHGGMSPRDTSGVYLDQCGPRGCSCQGKKEQGQERGEQLVVGRPGHDKARGWPGLPLPSSCTLVTSPLAHHWCDAKALEHRTQPQLLDRGSIMDVRFI